MATSIPERPALQQYLQVPLAMRYYQHQRMLASD